MPVRLDPTPNPNSVKITVPVSVSKAMTYATPEAAAADPLAARLFTIAGVQSVFRVANFVTVTKHPATEWDAIAEPLARAVEAHFA